jgi:hypothetical protein
MADEKPKTTGEEVFDSIPVYGKASRDFAANTAMSIALQDSLGAGEAKPRGIKAVLGRLVTAPLETLARDPKSKSAVERVLGEGASPAERGGRSPAKDD